MLTRRRLLHTLPLAAGGLWGCAKETPPPRYQLPEKPLSVVTTTVQAADLLQAVGGEAVVASSLIPALANPHLWQPTASDYGRLQLADAFFLSGLGLESKFTADLDSLRNQGLYVGVLANGLEDTDILKKPDGSPDPHYWMDPRLWAKAARQAGDTLTAAYPRAGLWFADRAHEYADTLVKVFESASEGFSSIPPKSRFVFTSHDSMAYFGAAYDLECRSLASPAGFVPDPIPEEITSWLSLNALKTIFREHFADSKMIRSMARPLNLGSDPEIFSLSLARPGTQLAGLSSEMDVSVFLSAMRYTIDVIRSRLALD